MTSIVTEEEINASSNQSDRLQPPPLPTLNPKTREERKRKNKLNNVIEIQIKLQAQLPHIQFINPIPS